MMLVVAWFWGFLLLLFVCLVVSFGVYCLFGVGWFVWWGGLEEVVKEKSAPFLAIFWVNFNSLII